MLFFNFVLVSAYYITQSSAYFTAPVICKNTSPECLKQTFQAILPEFMKGDPQIGVDSLDPFIIKNLTLSLPGDLKIELRRGSSRGLKKCIIDSARLVQDIFDLKFHCNLTIIGKYKSFGQLLIFVLNGDGDSMIRAKNIKIQLLAKLGSSIAEDGKKHLEIKAFKSNHSFEGQVNYRMTNLIMGNPQLSNFVVEFMNSNWKLVAEEFGKPIVDYGISSIIANVKKILKNVPQEQLIGTPDDFNVEVI